MKAVSSLGAKMALICIICLSIIAAIVAGFSTFQIGMLKQQMLRASERLAEEKARALARDLAEMDTQIAGGARDELSHRRALMDRVQLLIKQDNEVVFAGFVEVGEKGIKRVIAVDSQDRQLRGKMLKEGDSFEAQLGRGEKGELKVVFQREDKDMQVYVAPLDSKESPGLHLALGVRDSETYREIEAMGTLITKRVTLMAGILSGALILAFLAVWILFKGQTRLIQENEQLNRMAYVGTLASGLAHEIRNPLNAMSVNLGVVQEDIEDPQADSEPRIRQILGRLQHEVEELNETVVDFMAYAIPRETKRERIRPSVVLQSVIDSLVEQIRSREVNVELALDDSQEVDADPTGLRQVFHNITLNALEAMNGQERVLRIQSMRENGCLRMRFSDTGEGIDPKDLEKIFEPFHTAKARGSGFGLPIAQRIMREHGGRIWAESSPGHGATFHLEFPLPSTPRKA